MKLHRHLVLSLFDALNDVFIEGFYADKVVDHHFKGHRQWGAKDRAFIAETLYGMVRWWRWLIHVACLPQPENLNRSPEEHWAMLAAYLFLKKEMEELPDWPEFRDFQKATFAIEAKKLNSKRAIRESIPDWLDQRGVEELGPKWDSALKALNQPASVILRVNLLKTDLESVQKNLALEGIVARPIAVTADLIGAQSLELAERKNVFRSKAFQDGFFEVQDLGSQQIALLLAPKPGERVIDACAGAGGKSLHLASLMKNKGRIIAMDVHEKKLSELRRRASRAGADTIEIHLIDSAKIIKRFKGTADALLLDVPCSGMGVLRRNPDSKWKTHPEDFTRIIELQRQLLIDYSEMVKPSGRMVYATCSLFPSENEEQAKWFIQKTNESIDGAKWKLEREIVLRPETHNTDGFYAALLTRI